MRARLPAAPSARLETLVLLAMASSLTAIWLGLWVEWTRGAWLGGGALPRFWPAGLALAGLAAASLTRLALGRGLVRQRSARAALAGTGALAVFLLGAWVMGGPALASALRGEPGLAEKLVPALPALLAALYAWWQGQQLGRGPLGNQALRSAFNTGLIALAPLLVANTLLAALPSEKMLGALLLFFGLGLSGLALSSLRHLRPQQPAGSLVALALSRQWLVTSAAVIGLVLGAGLLAVRLAAPAALARALTGLLNEAGDGLGVVLSPLGVWIDRLVEALLPALSAFLERFMSALTIAFERLQGLAALLAELASRGPLRVFDGRRLQAFLGSPVFQASARWSGLLLGLAAAAIIFWLAARRLWRPAASDEDEQRDSVLSGRLLLAQLKNLLRRRRRQRPDQAVDYLALSGAPDDARLIIRRAYQGMLEWAGSLRLPRAAGQTPRAYAQMLAGAVPEGHEAIDLLTQAYVLARYAAETPSLEHARRAEGAIARLKALHSQPAGLVVRQFKGEL